MSRFDGVLPNIGLDRTSAVPLRRQLCEALVRSITNGEIELDQPLPSSRALAAHLGLARSTVVSCYLELEGEDWLRPVPGGGTYVSQRAVARLAQTGQPHHRRDNDVPQREFRFNLVPGHVDSTLLTSRAWRAAWTQELASERASPPCGEPELLAELARYLTSARGIPTTTADLVVCGGLTEAMLLLGLALGWAGRPVAVEDPCWPQVPLTLTRLGAALRCVDASTADSMVDDITSETHSPPAAAYLTPNSQYPLGHCLDAAQRRRLLAWSSRTGCVILEDDYDSEYRLEGPMPDALSAGDRADNVVYFGTLSKMLDPGLRVAYLRVPARLRSEVMRARRDLGTMTARAPQLIATRLLRSGEMARHTARLRRIYCDRRSAMVRSLATVPGVRRTHVGHAGLQVVARLEPGIESERVVRQAADHGLALVDLASFCVKSRSHGDALVLNFARHNPADTRAAIRLLSTLPTMRSRHA